MTPSDRPALVLVLGPEEVLAERAVDSIVASLRETGPDLDVVRLQAGAYHPGDLAVHASPSLFGGETLIVVSGVDEADDTLLDDLMDLLAAPADGVTLVLRHRGGNRGKRVLDGFRAAGARVIEAKALRTESDKTDFLNQEFQKGRRRVEKEAALALVHAVGKDVRELATACAQLMRDTTGVVTTAQVETYYGERVETTGFKVAEAALAGDEAQALRLLRHALTGGLDPVPIVAVLGMQLRQVGRVGAAGRGGAAGVAKDLGIAPWQVDQARRVAQGWDGERLGRAIEAVAAADVDVKGGLRTGPTVARSPEYAVERAVMTICRERRSR